MLALRICKKVYLKIKKPHKELPKCILNPDNAADLIYKSLLAANPIMIARYGSTELANIVNYLAIKNRHMRNIFAYIQGREPAWWWQDNLMQQLQNWSGFFPPTKKKISDFCELMIEDSKEVDVLGSWIEDEKYMDDFLVAKKVHLRFLEPFWSKNPWSKALENKKILVVSPFSRTILTQYEKRELLFENKDILPEFKSLTAIRAVQSLGKGDGRFNDWFEALEYMQVEIDKVDYDICLIGAGAYGFPLAAHVKRKGKVSVHMGGALQLLFGIRGKRWEDQNYGVKEWGIQPYSYVNLMNEYWVRLSDKETPEKSKSVEGACYW